jgi:predicted deacylase
MRWWIIPLCLPLASCTMPSIPAPWESTENPAREPQTGLAQPWKEPLWQRAGSSIRGKPIQAATFGTGSQRIYIIGGIHGDEPEGPAAIDLLAQSIAESPPADATIRIIRHLNPDGAAAGTRLNTRGVDLSRNWPAPDYEPGKPTHGARAGSELETSTIQKDILAFKPDLVVVLTSNVRGPAIAFDGPRPVRGFDFASAARREDPRWRLVTDPWKSSPGSVESYARLEMKRAVMTVELRRNSDPAQNARALAAGLGALVSPASK